MRFSKQILDEAVQGRTDSPRSRRPLSTPTSGAPCPWEPSKTGRSLQASCLRFEQQLLRIAPLEDSSDPTAAPPRLSLQLPRDCSARVWASLVTYPLFRGARLDPLLVSLHLVASNLESMAKEGSPSNTSRWQQLRLKSPSADEVPVLPYLGSTRIGYREAFEEAWSIMLVALPPAGGTVSDSRIYDAMVYWFLTARTDFEDEAVVGLLGLVPRIDLTRDEWKVLGEAIAPWMDGKDPRKRRGRRPSAPCWTPSRASPRSLLRGLGRGLTPSKGPAPPQGAPPLWTPRPRPRVPPLDAAKLQEGLDALKAGLKEGLTPSKGPAPPQGCPPLDAAAKLQEGLDALRRGQEWLDSLKAPARSRVPPSGRARRPHEKP